MRIYSILACAVCVLFDPAWSAAQDRIRVNIDAAEQTTTTAFTVTTTFTEFVEQGQITTKHTIAQGLVYGGGLTVRTWKNLVLGAAVSYHSKPGSAQLNAELPHPFLFDRPRLVSATASGLKRSEVGTHVMLGMIFPATDHMDIVVSGGPSIFQVQQDLVTRVTYTQTYPYDQVQFTGVTTQRFKDRTIGYHAAADVTVKFSRHVGVGSMLRFARGKLKATGGNPSFDVGGLYADGGLRIIF